MADAAVASLTSFAVGIAAIAVVIGIIAWMLDRRARRRGQQDAGLEPVPFSTWVRLHSVPLSFGGLVVIGLLVLSQITGPDVVIWAAAGAAVWLIGIRIIGGEDEPGVAPEPGT